MQLSQEAIAEFITEPFTAGRSTPRLLFDFSIMVASLNQSVLDYPVLDFGAGTGWVSEFCARMGLKTVSFDIHGDLKACLENRTRADRRINSGLLSFVEGDGHSMPFESNKFGHILCYDTVHHMHNYPKVFSEFHRVLRPGGRAIFVEPVARHSKSPETIAFVEAQKKHDPTWIERDVVLEEMDQIARNAGFTSGLSIIPMPHPLAYQTYSMSAWQEFRSGDTLQRLRFTDQLADLNYWDRVIFFVDKP
ncbi:class I SAM-dependent methyltransferase [Paraburkholderia saeva]|uniref:2-methoxy-6-polyprenyl-1,4-benzoquinol methylase, mitochondrial n=1 Tax=Paraburkholderia saeva TaxID=2777537 RepID=A0A9N8RS08_9BURK|nr:class I SAM-dependent methyltransferase [Paraburkholderia saeva]CAG4887771.1 2-methoxy-6-polyprenyl-1,4-benzoquinol methylase, mitochondrial [Paraburkholderia saeva]